MSVSTSRAAYTDCYEVFDQAISDPKGIRIRMRSYETAVHFRMRCHTARKLDREYNLLIHDASDPRHGISQYDVVTIKIRTEEGKVYLYFEKTDVIPGEVESLSGMEPEPALAPVDDFEDTPMVIEAAAIERIRRI